MTSLELGIIGNGSIAGLIDDQGAYQWMCLPRFDGQPVFNALLGGLGAFRCDLAGFKSSTQEYVRNTSVLKTTLRSSDGCVVDIIDFCPRFPAKGRTFRPMSFVRRIIPREGNPRITLNIEPSQGWSNDAMHTKRGTSHIRFTSEENTFRMTTDAPISYILSKTQFTLDRPVSIICTPDESLSDAPEQLARDWEERTVNYWQSWSRRLAIPFDYQDAVIRAAITLKLCVFEETGGIVAALTTSVPEHHGSERNWDYRFCWIRDAYFTVTALNRLSALATLEYYSRYLRNVAAHTDGGHIQPVYGVGLEATLEEHIVETMPGYNGHGPVRRGNQAAEHIQHDVYGQVVLAAAQAFFDRRLRSPAGEQDFVSLEKIGERAFEMHDKPDAGIWEYRTIAGVHTSSALMCWAACDRLTRIAELLGKPDRASYWRGRAQIIRTKIEAEAWSETHQAYMGAFGGDTLDASVLLMIEVGFVDGQDERFRKTVDAIDKTLRVGNAVYRYRHADDFGKPETAFTACTFWHIDALAMTGRREEARALFEHVLAQRTKLGLLSEDMVPETGELWGNFPQTYSMVGIINSATRLSRPWSEIC
ncbi:MAG: glycoside hydrolase family 15 protein [Pseudomonadota bacterium]